MSAHTNPSRSTKIVTFLLNLMLVVLLFGAALTLVSTAVGLVRNGNSLLGGHQLPVHAQLAPDQVRRLPPGVRLTHDVEVTVEVRDPSAKQLLLSTATFVGPFVLLAGTLWLLRGLALSVKEGDPFGQANVRRLRTLGFILVVGGPVVEIVNWVLRISLANTLPASLPVGTAGYRFPFELLLAGLGAFVLSEVFAYGVRLREDVEATI